MEEHHFKGEIALWGKNRKKEDASKNVAVAERSNNCLPWGKFPIPERVFRTASSRNGSGGATKSHAAGGERTTYDTKNSE